MQPTEASGGGDGVGDIEELCGLCEPLPAGSRVTSFPMKAAKKKAREEADIVTVIEWKTRSGGQSWFLLAKRPEKGPLSRSILQVVVVKDMARSSRGIG